MSAWTNNRSAQIARGSLAALCLAAMLLAWPCAAGADTITLKKIVYDDVKFISAGEGFIEFKFASASGTLRKPIADVDVISIDGQDEFNKAEKQLASGDFKSAAANYQAALAKAGPELRPLLQLRRLRALDGAGMIDEATGQWLAMLADSKEPAQVTSLRPVNIAPRGSSANARAIAAMEAAFSKLKANDEMAAAIQQQLMSLYRREARDNQLSQLLSGIGSDSRPATSQQASQPGSASEKYIFSAQMMIEQGQHNQAEAELSGHLREFPSGQLPTALFMLGKTQLAMAEKLQGEPRREMLIKAGLNLMRVVTYFSGYRSESLLLAGRVNEQLGNMLAARKAYEMVKTQFPSSPAADSARAALEQLKDK